MNQYPCPVRYALIGALLSYAQFLLPTEIELRMRQDILFPTFFHKTTQFLEELADPVSSLNFWRMNLQKHTRTHELRKSSTTQPSNKHQPC